jgi:hypothetical protein
MKVGAMKILKEFFFNHFKNTSGTFKKYIYFLNTNNKERKMNFLRGLGNSKIKRNKNKLQ